MQPRLSPAPAAAPRGSRRPVGRPCAPACPTHPISGEALCVCLHPGCLPGPLGEVARGLPPTRQGCAHAGVPCGLRQAHAPLPRVGLLVNRHRLSPLAWPLLGPGRSTRYLSGGCVGTGPTGPRLGGSEVAALGSGDASACQGLRRPGPRGLTRLGHIGAGGCSAAPASPGCRGESWAACGWAGWRRHCLSPPAHSSRPRGTAFLGGPASSPCSPCEPLWGAPCLWVSCLPSVHCLLCTFRP